MARTFEFVDLVTEDGVDLPGGYWEPDPGKKGVGVDAWILFTGTQGAFYHAVQRPFIFDLVELGYPCFTPNPRGRDMAWRNRSDGRLMGFTYEVVSDCVYDFRASVNFLRSKGYERIGYLGHSLGAIKGFYHLSQSADPGIAAFVGVSPPRSCYERWSEGPRAGEFLANLEEAKRLAAEGKGNDPVLMSHPQGPAYYTPNTFIDRYADGRYDTLSLASGIKVPMLLTRGSLEREILPDDYLEDLLGRATKSSPSVCTTVEGADHFYTGGAHAGVIEAIKGWAPGLS